MLKLVNLKRAKEVVYKNKNKIRYVTLNKKEKELTIKVSLTVYNYIFRT